MRSPAVHDPPAAGGGRAAGPPLLLPRKRKRPLRAAARRGIVFFFLAAAAMAAAAYGRSTGSAGPLRAPEEVPDTSYEIISHRLWLQIFPSQNGIRCVDTFGIRLLAKDVRTLRLRFLPAYEIEGMQVNGRKADVERGGEYLRIGNLPGGGADSVLLQCVLSFSGQLNFRSEFSLISKDRAVLREEEFLPYGQLRRLQDVRMAIVVPGGWDVVAPGERLPGVRAGGDSLEARFRIREVVPMIGWICAGRFRNVRSKDGRVEAYLFPEDSSDAGALIAQAGEALDFYSRRFSPYRFATFTIVEVDDWVAGRNVLAIAVPSMVLVKKLALTTGDKFNKADAVLPHEVAHQWWPMTAFIRDEDAALLAEGMCEYSALLFNEHAGKLSARDSLKHHPLLRSLLLRIQQGKDIALQQKADLRSIPTHYLKSSYVHNMLRRIMGDSAFFGLYREWASRFLGRRGSQADFRKLAGELSGGKDLSWFFEQWTAKRGIPHLKIYNVRSQRQGPSSWVTRGRARILGYEKYTAPVDAAVETPDGKLVKTGLWLGTDSSGVYHNDVPFEITSRGGKPRRALLDPSGDVLKFQKLPVKLSDLRDPSDGIMIVGTNSGGGGGGAAAAAALLECARQDSARMEQSWWSLTIKPDTGITLADLQREHVFLYGKPSENRVVADLQSKFPLGFLRGTDSIDVGGEAMYDSSLALLQCVENPYVSQGTLVWVAPLSGRAHPELGPYESSWVVIRGKEEISSGTWEVTD